MKLFTSENGAIYHTYMFNGIQVVFFMDYRDAETLQLSVIDTDEFGHAAVRYDDVKKLPVEEWKDDSYWPQCLGYEEDDCDIVLAEVSMEDACTDVKARQFCSKRFYEFEVKWDNGEIV